MYDILVLKMHISRENMVAQIVLPSLLANHSQILFSCAVTSSLLYYTNSTNLTL